MIVQNDFPLDPLLIRFKRAVEKLKLFDSYPSKDYSMASVNLTIITDSNKTYYSIQRHNLKYCLVWNFDGGCSQSVEFKKNLDLDDVFDWFDSQNQAGKAKKLEIDFKGLREPSKYLRFLGTDINGKEIWL